MKNIFKICSCTPTPEVVDVQAPTSSLAELGSAKRRQCFRVTLCTAHALVCLYKDIEGQDEKPGQIKYFTRV